MLIGTDAANRLVANGGDDILFDGTGLDTLSGGAGTDTFILTYDEILDIITNFDPNVDILDLSAWPGLRSMAQLGMRTTDIDIQITYGNEVLELRSMYSKPITPDMLNESHMLAARACQMPLSQASQDQLSPPPAQPRHPQRDLADHG